MNNMVPASCLLIGLLLLGLGNSGNGMQTGSGVSSQPTQETKLSMRDRDLLESLRGGGHVIFFRYATPEDNSTNRTLSAEDESQAREIGAAFHELGIPIGQVFSSSGARSRSELMFGDEKVETSETLGSSLSQYHTGTQVETLGAGLHRTLATPPRGGTNTVVIALTSSPQPDEEVLVFKPLGEGSFQRVAITTQEQWAEFAGSPR